MTAASHPSKRTILGGNYDMPRIEAAGLRLLTFVAIGIGTIYTIWISVRNPSTFSFFVMETAVAVSLGTATGMRRLSRSRSQGFVRDSQAILVDDAVRRKRLSSLLTIGFTLTLSAALLGLRSAMYTAPLWFYFALGLCAATIASNIHVRRGATAHRLLAQIIVLAAVVKLYFFFLNPYVYTSDAFLQFQGIQAIGLTGRVPESLGYYYFFPGFAIYSDVGVVTIGMPPESYGLLGLLASLLLIPAVYALLRELFPIRTALWGTLLSVFTLFCFLPVQYNPGLFGVTFIFFAVYALVRAQRGSPSLWLVAFWGFSMAAFLSHPVNGLILAVLLLLRTFVGRFRFPGREGRLIAPTLSYLVAYVTYVVLVAVIAFQAFVAGFISPINALPFITRPSPSLQGNVSYLLQSALAPASSSVMFFLASRGIFDGEDMPTAERLFATAAGVAFVTITAVEFVTGNFALQSSRLLVYLTLPLVILAARGLSSVLSARSGRRTAAILVGLFAATGFLASSSYMTNNDFRGLYANVPAVPTHISESALSARGFLGLTPPASKIYLDFGSLVYFVNLTRARNALLGRETYSLEQLSSEKGSAFVGFDRQMAQYGNAYSGSFFDLGQLEAYLDGRFADHLYDNGQTEIYFVGSAG